MPRSLLALVAGLATSGTLRFMTDRAFIAVMPEAFSEGTPVDVSFQVLMLAYALLYALLSGYVAAAIAGHEEAKHSLALAAVQLVLGITMAGNGFDRVPLWWHFSHLALVAPVVLMGGYMRAVQVRDTDGYRDRGLSEGR